MTDTQTSVFNEIINMTSIHTQDCHETLNTLLPPLMKTGTAAHTTLFFNAILAHAVQRIQKSFDLNGGQWWQTMTASAAFHMLCDDYELENGESVFLSDHIFEDTRIEILKEIKTFVEALRIQSGLTEAEAHCELM